jgi:hypothetical protein
MRKIVLSTITALTIGSVAADAASITLYEDANGQVFTKPGAGRTKMIIDSSMITNKVEETYSTPKTVKLSKDEKDEIKQDILAEVKKSTPLFAKADKLKFSVLTYLGYTFNDHESGSLGKGENTPRYTEENFKEDTSEFELRRAYFQVKAYLLEDPKSYYRVTFDVHQDDKMNGDTTDGDNTLRVKYTYLYLNEVLPYTGVELGIAHRPWHDYEEHNAWYFRDISKVLVEQGNGAHLSNSADFGINFKTKTKYFDSEIGLFNGEGYHDIQNGKGMSFEWRTTAHLLGVDGKDKEKKLTYWDASFFGQYNKDHKTITDVNSNEETDEDLIFMGLHTVYNQPDFLVSAQYIYSDDTRDSDISLKDRSGSAVNSNTSSQSGEGYSVNAEYRLGAQKQFRILGRYDSWTPEAGANTDSADWDKEYEQKTYIAGLAWDQNKNVQWVVNVDITDNEEGSGREKYNGTAYMFTTRLKF